MIELKCGDCAKFHTKYCPNENAETLKEGVYWGEPNYPACEHFVAKKVDDLIQFFSDKLLEDFTLRHFCRGGKSIDLFMWKDGAYIQCEEYLRSYIEALAREMGIQSKVKSHVVNEAIEKTKRRTYYELGEEPCRIAFNNIVLDWEAFLKGDGERAYLPLNVSKEIPCFHKIPHMLDLEFFDKVVQEVDFRRGAEENAGEVVEVFRSWVGDCWPLLFEIIGYCLYPSHGLHKAFMLVGDGRNGKSTYLKLIHKILGEDNVIGISLQDLCMNRFSQASLYHKLANIYADIPNKPLAYTGYFKMLTGEDLISADRKFKERLTFKNYAKLLFSANALPEVNDLTEAFWRRWIIVEFPNKFEENPTFFEQTFTEEAIERVIVLSLIAFADAWISRKFSIEGDSMDYKEKWLRRSNSIYAYVKEGVEEGRIRLEASGVVKAEELYEDYVAYCNAFDYEVEQKRTFTAELERLFKVVKVRARVGGEREYLYKGIALERRFGEDEEEEVQGRL